MWCGSRRKTVRPQPRRREQYYRFASSRTASVVTAPTTRHAPTRGAESRRQRYSQANLTRNGQER
ncbi:hypothetical protein C9J85_06025 [Haloferax sp. wsp5]|nr:hypothetical protein C9J85_06025 [Haloferax sp. wsp5]